MTITELITLLQERLERHGDRDVLVTWAGIVMEITPAHIYLTTKGPLYIDADNNYYKERWAVPEERTIVSSEGEEE